MKPAPPVTRALPLPCQAWSRAPKRSRALFRTMFGGEGRIGPPDAGLRHDRGSGGRRLGQLDRARKRVRETAASPALLLRPLLLGLRRPWARSLRRPGPCWRRSRPGRLGCDSARWSLPVTFRQPAVRREGRGDGRPRLPEGASSSASAPAGTSASTRRTASVPAARRADDDAREQLEIVHRCGPRRKSRLQAALPDRALLRAPEACAEAAIRRSSWAAPRSRGQRGSPARFADEYNVNFAAPEACRAARARLDEAASARVATPRRSVSRS
jgi:hypothetical protein